MRRLHRSENSARLARGMLGNAAVVIRRLHFEEFQSGGVGQHTRDLGLARPESGGARGLLGCVAFHLVQQGFVGLVGQNCTCGSRRAMKAASAAGTVLFLSSSSASTRASSIAVPAPCAWRDGVRSVAGQDDTTLIPGGGQHDLLQGSPVDVAGLADRVADCADEAREVPELVQTI
jgi:hypothetical protein